LDQPDGGELLQITYSDDGRGLDIKKITENAVTKSLITEYEANNLTRERAVELIYEKGFSTSKEIDKQSGRGQGMSLVSNLISDLNGSFKVDFEEGKFFKIIINIPLIPQQITENKADEIANS
jgi:two-component system chemotaxis sensor kinase CheA